MRIERVRVLEVNNLVWRKGLGLGARRVDLVSANELARVGNNADPRRRYDPELGRPEPAAVGTAPRRGIPVTVASELVKMVKYVVARMVLLPAARD